MSGEYREALDRNLPIQAGLLTVIGWTWEVVGMGKALFTTGGGLITLVATPCLCLLLTFAVRRASALFARGMIQGLSSAGNIKYQQTFSIQESLIARGRYDEAVTSFRDHLAAAPDDIPARYRLATLHLRERQDPAAAEEELLALRRRPLDAGMALLVSNHLIDIYRATDQRGRLMAELTRMMKERPGTPMGEGAAKLLAEVRRDR